MQGVAHKTVFPAVEKVEKTAEGDPAQKLQPGNPRKKKHLAIERENAQGGYQGDKRHFKGAMHFRMGVA
ncbi:MAG TPA: hypothetical protein VJ112_01515 [Rhabdochlamydiaceae bacterium]|nr:hypothetical protein [Rhabdochlamydiaceae bacterium]